jgi:hypothetical protein
MSIRSLALAAIALAASLPCRAQGGGGSIYNPPTNIPGNAHTADQLKVAPSGCPPGQYIYQMAANGTPTCSSPFGYGISSSNYVNTSDLAKWSFNTTFTASSGNVVLAAGDPTPLCPGGTYPCASPTTGGDLGKVCFGTNFTGTPSGYVAYAVIMHEGTVDSITNATHLHCTTTSSASVTGTFVWANFVDAGLTSWWAAATNYGGPCRTAILNTGGYLLKAGNFNTMNCSNNFPVSSDQALQVNGEGMRTTLLIFSPDSFDYTTCPVLVGTGGNPCFFGHDGIRMHDFTISGMGNDAANSAANGTTATYIGCDGDSYNLDVFEWQAGNANTKAFRTSPCGTNTWNLNDEGGGGLGIEFEYNATGGRHNTGHSYFCCNLIGAAKSVAGTIWQDHGSGFQFNGCNDSNPVVDVFGQYAFDGTLFSNSCTSGLAAIVIESSAVGNFTDQAGCIRMGGNSTCLGSYGGGVTYAQNSTFVGSGTGGGVQTDVTGSPAKFFDQGGNSVSGGSGNAFRPNTLYGDGSITGIADVAANHTLTSGWGTAAVSAVSGATKGVQFTISVTAGSPAASPVLTDTFASGFAFGITTYSPPPPSGGCSLIQIAGNFGDLTNPVPSSLTNLGVTWTFTGTPVVGHSYTFVRSCSNS